MITPKPKRGIRLLNLLLKRYLFKNHNDLKDKTYFIPLQGLWVFYSKKSL